MKFALAAIGGSLALAGCAAGPKEPDHAAHHPSVAAEAGPAASAPGAMNPMQQMHDKMMAAKTPEERAKMMQMMKDREAAKPPAAP